MTRKSKLPKLVLRLLLSSLCLDTPKRRAYQAIGGQYADLRGVGLAPLPEIDEEAIARICTTVRGFIFSTIDGAKSGHPGGSSSKVEQLVTLLCSGTLRFNPARAKDPCRDRIVWSAGHCSPLAHSLNALIYEALRVSGYELTEEELKSAIYPDDLPKFRTLDGPSGHVESHYALADTSTGSSGHGFSAGLGFALLHKSSGLPTKAFVIAGDAETEEGMSYEARNIAVSAGADNLIVLLDNNGYGIDGHISQAIATPIQNHWLPLGWNVIEVNGHNIRELAYAYSIAEDGFGNKRPTVIISHTTKGFHYGKLEDTSDSHGTPLSHDDFVLAMNEMGFGHVTKETTPTNNISTAWGKLYADDVAYLVGRLGASAENILPEKKAFALMKKVLSQRTLTDHTLMKRPAELPPELVFKQGEGKATRFATEAFFAWMMKNHGFFYVGTGDLSKSILTCKAENEYGLISSENPTGRGIRFGIAEQNMAMMMVTMSQDTLPGGVRPLTAFASYGVFTSMMANAVRMGLVNNAMNPDAQNCFIMLAAHDGPETGEDGPTHHGLFWMSLFTAYPGIKVYKPLDANEAIEMLFLAIERNEPVAFSVARANTPVFTRKEGGDTLAPASLARQGAYVFKPYVHNRKPKLPIAVAGGQVLANLLKVLPKIEERYDVKVVAVTSPELFEELYEKSPLVADAIWSDADRKRGLVFHNGWKGFMHSFILPENHNARIFGIDRFLKSGRPDEIYKQAGFDADSLATTILGNAYLL